MEVGKEYIRPLKKSEKITVSEPSAYLVAKYISDPPKPECADATLKPSINSDALPMTQSRTRVVLNTALDGRSSEFSPIPES